MAVPNPTEVCNVSIGSFAYQTWDTAMVQTRWLEGFPVFEVSVTEEVPGPKSFAAYRFNVGDTCTISLAGFQVIDGLITQRQSAADAERHAVQLIGKGRPWQMVKSSIAPPLGNFDGQTLLQVVSQIAAQTAVGVLAIGQLELDAVQQAASGARRAGLGLHRKDCALPHDGVRRRRAGEFFVDRAARRLAHRHHVA